MTPLRTSWLLVGAIGALAGCGSAPISEDASTELAALVDATWDAAEVGDADAAAGELDVLRVRARELYEDGELQQGRLEEVLAAADEVDAHLGLLGGQAPAEPDDGADRDDDDDVDRDDDGDVDRDDDDDDDDDDEEEDEDEEEKDKDKEKEEKEGKD